MDIGKAAPVGAVAVVGASMATKQVLRRIVSWYMMASKGKELKIRTGTGKNEDEEVLVRRDELGKYILLPHQPGTKTLCSGDVMLASMTRQVGTS